MSKWKYLKNEKPQEDGFYYVIAYNNECFPPHTFPLVLYFEDGFGFDHVEVECGGEKNIIAWAEVEYPEMPSKNELISNGLGDRIMEEVEVRNR